MSLDLSSTHYRPAPRVERVNSLGVFNMGKKSKLNYYSLGQTQAARAAGVCTGCVRMLLALVQEFVSHLGEILTLFAKINKGQLLRAPSVGGRNSTRADEGEQRAEVFAR